MPHPAIEGPRLTLRPLERADLPLVRAWRADPAVVRFWGRLEPEVSAMWEYSGTSDSWTTHAFVIEQDGRGLGVIGYSQQVGSEHAHEAGIDIYLGAAESRDRGVGTEAVRTMLAYLFEARRLQRVTIDPEVANARAVRAYEKAGFRFERVIPGHDEIDGRSVDAHFMAIAAAEWTEARARRDAEGGAG